MSLEFPNSSRSFDNSKSRINFWGYDRTIEVSYFIGADVLQRFSKDLGTQEAELLEVFDAKLDKIRQVAARVYEKSSKGKGAYTFILNDGDF
jgi:energy-converting hydrogenase A subunit M